MNIFKNKYLYAAAAGIALGAAVLWTANTTYEGIPFSYPGNGFDDIYRKLSGSLDIDPMETSSTTKSDIGRPLTTLSNTGVVITRPETVELTDDWPALSTLSNEELAAKYKSGGSAERADIISEMKNRDQRATDVTAEFFPEMTYQSEHNAFITITRSRTSDTLPEPSEAMMSMITQTIEPTAFEIKNTATTNEVGAQLIGANFTIKPSEMQWRYVEDGGEDTFAWNVTPQKEGNQQLLVILRNKLRIGDTELILPVRQFPRTVTVSVDIWTHIGRTVTGVETAVGTAQKLGVAIAAIFGFGSIGALWTAFHAWRKRRSSAAV